MLDLSLLPDGGASWLDASGEHADIVISTRIRLARNLEGYAFTPRARDGERLRILTQVREAFGSLRSIEDGVLVRVDERQRRRGRRERRRDALPDDTRK